MVSTAKVRRALLGSVLAAGLGLFGISVNGLVSLDAQLSDAAQRSAPARSVPVVEGDRDCPLRDRRRVGPRPYDLGRAFGDWGCLSLDPQQL